MRRCLFLIIPWLWVCIESVLFAQDTLMTIGTNFWDQAWGGADPWKNGYQNAIDPDSIDTPAYNPWKTEFIDEISFYSVLRFMDYGRINNNQDEVVWEDRTKKESKDQGRMALYWMIDLCNRAGSDLWLCFPEKSAAGYWQGAAELINQELDPNLKVYIEWSNETWNPQFSAYQTGIDSGKVYDLWFPGDDDKSWGEQRLSARYTVFISAQIWEMFADVFGEAFDSRVVKVLCGSAGNDWWDAVLANALNDPAINPENRLPDAFGIAPYVGVSNGADSDVIEQMYTQMTQSENSIKKVRTVLNGTGEWTGQMPPHPGLNGLPLCCYEAGQHIVNASSSFAVNPGAFTWYLDYLDMLSKYMKGPVAHYTHSGTWGNMAWGAKNNIGQAAGEAPKFMALNNWHLLHVVENPGPRYTLTVNTGSGSGTFFGGMYTFIEAGEGPEGQVFEKWEGDTVYVTDIRKRITTVSIIDRDITLTAVFKEPQPVTRIEAEGAELTGVIVKNSRAGYSGTGYVDGSSFDADEDKITFTLEAAEAGSCNLRIGYGGFYGEKYQYIYVNGNNLAYFHFPETSTWETIDYGMIELNGGMNTVSIVKSWGWMDVDFIEIEGEGIVSLGKNSGQLIDGYHLYDNFPDPFNPSTTIPYKLAQSGEISITVYDVLGQVVDHLVQGYQSPGEHSVIWDVTDKRSMTSGIYLYRLEADVYSAVKRMLLLK